jgi:hypothetical protein
VHGDHRVPLGFGHVDQHAVTEDACVVDHDVQTPVALDRQVNHRLGLGKVCDVATIGHRLAARLDDLGHHLVRRTIVLTAVSATVAAKVVHHHFGAVLGQHQRMLAADAPPGTGHQTDASLTQFCHALPSRVRVALRRRG